MKFVTHRLIRQANSLDALCQCLKGVQSDHSDHFDHRAFLAVTNDALNRLTIKDNIQQSLAIRTQAVDRVLSALLHDFVLDRHYGLYAVGGYGRRELFLHSDVDILLLSERPITDPDTAVRVANFVARLWDIGITPALAIRDLDACRHAIRDHTIATALLEARHVSGLGAHEHLSRTKRSPSHTDHNSNDGLSDHLSDAPHLPHPSQLVKAVWTIGDFFRAKYQEASERHLSHNSTEYNLEPNIKSAPGGLRDLHLLVWLGRFYFESVHDLGDLVATGLISQDECDQLTTAKTYLHWVRHLLHRHSDKAQERLLFEYQLPLAELMGFGATSEHGNAPAEKMMHQFYRHAMTVAALGELICDSFYHQHILNATKVTTTPLAPLIADRTNSIRNHQSTTVPITYHIHDTQDASGEPRRLIGIDHTSLAQLSRSAAIGDVTSLVFELFLLMGHQAVRHVEPATLQAVRKLAPLILPFEQASDTAKRLFLANIAERNCLFHRLRLMKRHGVLGRYLPDMERVTGLMQYDLYHRYTVDAHTLLAIRILHRIHEQGDQYAIATGVYRQIGRKDLLILAVLFHDLAKGLGGDHSLLGSELARRFCVCHGLDTKSTELVAWLIKEHLTMSHTSQKKDVADPKVIDEFAETVGDITHLNHLYVLTVADMSATNSELFNSWRATLLRQLYVFTHHRLSHGSDHDSAKTIIQNRKINAAALLSHHQADAITALWQSLGDRYLLAHSSEVIAWHTHVVLKHLAKASCDDFAIAVASHNALVMDATQLVIYAPKHSNLFAKTVAVLGNFGLDVLAATLISPLPKPNQTPFSLDSYVLVDKQSTTALLDDPARIQTLIRTLKDALASSTPVTPKHHHHSHRGDAKLRYFAVPTQVLIHKPASDDSGTQGITIITKDRFGLLAKIGQVFDDLGIWVHEARIVTMGERVEDSFDISDMAGQLVHDAKLDALKDRLIRVLGDGLALH